MHNIRFITLISYQQHIVPHCKINFISTLW